jgi:hypothetical protein
MRSPLARPQAGIENSPDYFLKLGKIHRFAQILR